MLYIYIRASTPRPTRLLVDRRFFPRYFFYFLLFFFRSTTYPRTTSSREEIGHRESVNQRYRIVGKSTQRRIHLYRKCRAYISSVIDLSASRIAASTPRNVSHRAIQTSLAFPRLHVSYVLSYIYIYVYTYIERISTKRYIVS